MKYMFLAFLFCAAFTASALAQDRTVPSRRVFQPSPQLSVIHDTDNAAGIAQTPYGHALTLGGPIPAGSTVGVYGHFLLRSANKVLLWSDGGVVVVDAETSRYPFFGLEMVTFRLPVDLRGDVWVTTVGRLNSNTVKIVVE